MKIIAKTSFTVFLLVALVGCDSMVERPEPSTSISQGEALSDPDAIQGVRAAMYDEFHTEDMSTDWLLGPSALADNTFFRRNQQRHQGQNVNNRGSHLGSQVYNEAYDAINTANLLIDGIEEGAIPEARADKLAAEGLFIRSLVHHHLVRIFGYDPDEQGGVLTPAAGPGSGWDLGIVLRTQGTLDLQDAEEKPRATVPEVYDQLVSDLNSAIDLFDNLPDQVRESSTIYPSEAAAEALLARVQLYNKNYQAAEDAASRALDLAELEFGASLAQPGELIDIFDETTGDPEVIFKIATDPETEAVGVNNALSAYTSMQWMAQIPTQDLLDLYEDGDARRDEWYDPCFDEQESTRPGGCDEINIEEDELNKGDFDGEVVTGLELEKYNSEQDISQFADDHVHLRVGELKLIQAEARLNGASGSPEQPINELRNARGLNDLEGSLDIDEILDERRRELVAEGHRFFDLKRLGRDIRKIEDLPGKEGRPDLDFNRYWVLDNLPTDEVENNDELVQNPEY
jgi:tetratricopeptide (TPR) repeat protein